MPKITMFSRTITSACILTVEAGSNCPQGGDSGHGGHTIFRLIDEGATAMDVGVDGQTPQSAKRIEIVLGGDCEAECFAQALEFGAQVIRGQIGNGLAEWNSSATPSK
jgi:hypothetical protein